MASFSTSSSSGCPVFDPTKEEEETIQLYRNLVRQYKSLGCSPVDSAGTASREVMSESIIDVLTLKEIEDLRNKVFRYCVEKKSKKGQASEDKVEESKVALHQGSDPRMQHEEAVPSFEDAKCDVATNTSTHQDIGKLIETELKNLREAKLSESEVEEMDQGLSSRSEKMDFTELKKKAADLPVITELKSTKRKKQLPILRKTDPLELVIMIYDCLCSDPAGTLENDAKEAIDESLVPKVSDDQEFRKNLVFEMRILYTRLVSTPRIRAPSANIEAEGESSSSVQTKDSTFSSKEAYSAFFEEAVHSSSVQTKDSTFSSPEDMEGSLGQSITEYPEETRESAGKQQVDDTMANMSPNLDSSSLSGLVNIPQFTMPEGVREQSSIESGNSSASTVCSDNTLSDISSLPTDTTSGARSSVSSLRDADALASPLSKVPPEVLVEKTEDDDAFGTLPLTSGDAGASRLAVPQVPRLPPSLDDSTQIAEAEDHGRRRRDRSPKEDENLATKRQAL